MEEVERDLLKQAQEMKDTAQKLEDPAKRAMALKLLEQLIALIKL
jgi:hypothetical protein